MIGTKLKLVALACAALASTPALADRPAIAVSGGTSAPLGNGPYTVGFTFSIAQDFSVTGLGVFDADNDGLVESHQIGLFDNAGTLLGSTTVGAGAVGTLIGGFRYASLTPFRIGAGTYRIGAVFSGTPADPLFYPAGTPGLTAPTVTSAAGVTYIGSSYGDQSASLSFPSNDNGTGGYIGPNALLSSVPEPATWGLMILGFGATGMAMRRRRSVRTTVSYG